MDTAQGGGGPEPDEHLPGRPGGQERRIFYCVIISVFFFKKKWSEARSTTGKACHALNLRVLDT